MVNFGAGPGAETLARTVEAVQQAVRDKPEDADLRARLFQVLAVCGQWERARRQLAQCASLDARAQPLAWLYDAAMQAEQEREQALWGRQPLYLPDDAAPWLRWLSRALECTAAGDVSMAEELRNRALDAAPPAFGTLTVEQGQGGATQYEFQWLADGDCRLGPACEMFADGRYTWVAFSDIAECRLSKPAGVTDLLWMPAELVLRDGRSRTCLIPARYCPVDGDNYQQLDDDARLSRRTAWREIYPGHYIGIGQKMWMTDAGDYGLLDLRSVQHG